MSVDSYQDMLEQLSLDGQKERGENEAVDSTGLAHKFLREKAQEATKEKIRQAQEQVAWKEVTVDKNGQVRQAGADLAEGEFVKGFKKAAEEDLYVFSKGVMGRRYLTKGLHLPLCKGLQQVPPFRKLRLLPRDHCKCAKSLDFFNKYQKRLPETVTPGGKIIKDSYITASNGLQDVYQVTTETGKEFNCTDNHPFLKWGCKWVSIKDGLKKGDWIGTVRRGSFGDVHEPEKAALLGWLLADGCLYTAIITAQDPEEQQLLFKVIEDAGFQWSRHSKEVNIGVLGVRQWLRELNLEGLSASQKFVPEFVLRGDEETVRAFLYELIRHDGTKYNKRDTTGRAIAYTTISKDLAQDVQHLLIKFGLHVKLYPREGVVCNGKIMPSYKWYLLQFTDYTGIVYEGQVEPTLTSVTDTFPPQWRERVPKGMGYKLRQAGIRIDNKYATTRRKVREVAEFLGDNTLLALCDSDISWERVTEIKYTGKHDTIAIETTQHTLTCGDIITHNTSVVGHCLPTHILIQPKESNIYFPGMDGSECRIMLAGETERRAKGNLRVIATAAESNKVLRALWPEKIWERPKAQSKKWSDEALIFPRENDYPDPTIFAVGVGGAIAGARPNVQIKDDLISLEAANSETVMNTAIEWHIASRALMDEYEKDSGLESIEIIIGTRWAVFDLYEFIINGGDFADKHFDPDPTMDILVRSIIEDGKPIWPERFDMPRVEQLQREFGSLFYLMYMNAAHDPSLVDFDINDVRGFKFVADGRAIEYDVGEMDAILQRKLEERGMATEHVTSMRGQVLNDQTWGLVFGGMEMGRGEWFKRNARPSPLAVRLRS